MNNHAEGGYQPPPPPPLLGEVSGAGNDVFLPRQSAVRPGISTAVSGSLSQVQSALSPASPYPYGSPYPGIDSPRSAYAQADRLPFSGRTETSIMDYNPQQWGRGGPTGGIYRPHATLTVPVAPRPLDDNGQPLDSPPPPYTPNAQSNPRQSTGPRSHPQLQTNFRNMSHLASELTSPASPVTAISPLATRNRIDAQVNFPPPPNQQRDRSTSRSRFGLSALTRGKSSDRSGSSNAIETLQHVTREALANAPIQQWNQNLQQAMSPSQQPSQSSRMANRSTMYIETNVESPIIPPSARRSASAGAVSQWTPGMPLPPPPSGPPPSAGSRSASMSRASPDLTHAIAVPSSWRDSGVPIIAAPTRRPPHRGTKLGPIPPTPAGYGEFPKSPMPQAMRDRTPDRGPEVSQAATAVDTSDAHSSTGSIGAEPSQLSTSSSWSGSLKREPSAKGIRERRSESRAAKDRQADSTGESSTVVAASPPNVAPPDLVLSPSSSAGGGRISRSGAMKKARRSPIESSGVSSSMKVPQRLGEASSPSRTASCNSGNPFLKSTALGKAASTSEVPSTLTDDHSSPLIAAVGISNTSHIVSIPDNTRSMSGSAATIPNSATRPESQSSELPSDTGGSFAMLSIRRHQEFVRQESACSSDAERLQLFAEYMVAESRIRRDQYSAAFASMEPTDVNDMTRNLWRTLQATPAAPRPASTVPSSASSMPHPSRTDSMGSILSITSPIFGSQANQTPLTEPDSPASIASSSGNPRDCGPWARHQPVLSPILSMAMSTTQDEQDSRGRSASRWWESSAGSTGVSQRIERSKRESKFMGVPHEALASLQWQDEPSPSLLGGTPRNVGDYPVEKTGWGNEEGQGPASTPRYMASIPATPDPHQVDVSRLVTLPPPYPRHHPAMANNHPDLAPIRQVLDNLRDVAEIKQRRSSFNAKRTQRHEQLNRESAERRSEMRHNIQEQVSLGQMNYAQAASAEKDFNSNESHMSQAAVRLDYDNFQPHVMTPLHAVLSEKITRGTASMMQMYSKLSDSSTDGSPNQPQEEGNEQPELLEKLNLLKWLFEARESLYKALDDLEGQRNDLYREVIMRPLQDTNDEAKLLGAQQFFDKDKQERKAKFEKSANVRYEEFATKIEKIVTRGVEDQLSAFWDIAPGLSSIVNKVPDDLETEDFEVHVPGLELEENPQYGQHPLQYLYTLLTHAEKSTYQFFESQINLMCLLHEAHTGLMFAGTRLMECQRVAEGEELAQVTREMTEIRSAEEQRLTYELKEKVATVESQWREGLGSGLTAVKERVMDHLYKTGGWDESLLE